MCHFKVQIALVALAIVGHVCACNDDEIKTLLGRLHCYEYNITQILQHPQLSERVKISESLENFNKEFANLVSAVRESNCSAANLRFRNSGPHFLQLKLNNEHLKKIFNWTEDNLHEMYYALGASEVIWFELKQLDPRGEPLTALNNVTNEELLFLQQMDKENRLNEFIEFTKLDDFQRTDVPPRKTVLER